MYTVEVDKQQKRSNRNLSYENKLVFFCLERNVLGDYIQYFI